jgi:hypothetical protein
VQLPACSPVIGTRTVRLNNVSFTARTPRAQGNERGPLDVICSLSLSVHTADRFHMAGQRSIGASGPSHIVRRAWGIGTDLTTSLSSWTRPIHCALCPERPRLKKKPRTESMQKLRPLFCICAKHGFFALKKNTQGWSSRTRC